MAKIPLQDMSDRGYENMPEWSGYILRELKDFAKIASDKIEQRLTLEDIQPLIDHVEKHDVQELFDSFMMLSQKVEEQDTAEILSTIMILSERVEALADVEANLMLVASQFDKYATKEETFSAINYLADQADQHKVYTTITTITAAEMLALNASPKVLVQAPGAGKYVEVMRAELLLTYGTTAYTAVDNTKDLVVGYETSGMLVQLESTGLLDQVTDQRRVAHHTNSHLVAENETVTIKTLAGEVLTGDSELKVKVEYRIAELLI